MKLLSMLSLLIGLGAGLFLTPAAALAQDAAPAAETAEAAPAETETPPATEAAEEEEKSVSMTHPLVLLIGLVLEFGASLLVTAFAFKVMEASGTWTGFLIIAAVNALVVFLVKTGLLLSTGTDATFYVDQSLAFFITIPVIKKCTYVHDWVDAVKLAFAIRLGTFLAGMLLQFLLIMLAAALMSN